MIVKVKKLNELAVVPKYAEDSDSTFDLIATSKTIDEYGNICYGTGLSIEIPVGYIGVITPRLSNIQHEMTLSPSAMIIESNNHDEIKIHYKRDENEFKSINNLFIFNNEYNVGDRVAQMIIIPVPFVKFELKDN